MVSEPPPWRSYAAAVSGGASSDAPPNDTPPVVADPVPQQGSVSQQQRSRSTEDVENPLFLGTNESSCAVLVSPPLTGSPNYTSWSISMRIALEIKNKWCLIDGSIPAPRRDDLHFPAWRRCNLMVCAWIFKAVSTPIAQSIMHLDSAVDVWDDLKRRFSQHDAQRISALQSDIYNLRQGTLTVNDYYTKCKILWEEMNVLRPLPYCTCNPRCRCDLVDSIRKSRDEDNVIRFLQGLNDEYSSLKANVLVLDPIPDVHKVFVMAEKVERQLRLDVFSLNSGDLSQANALQTGATHLDLFGRVLC